MTSFAAVILAAGVGRRMNSRTPKALHEVCGKPMAAIVSETVRSAGFGPIVAVVPGPRSAIVDTLGQSCKYAFQSEPLGTGDALLRARDAVGNRDNVLVINADVPLIRAGTLDKLGRTHIRSEAVVTMLTAEVIEPAGLGRVVRNSAGQVTSVVEHSEADEETLQIREINAGVYCFRSDWLWDSLPLIQVSRSGEVYLTDLIGIAASSEYTKCQPSA